LIFIGIAIGVLIIAIDEWQRTRHSPLRVPVLAVAVGIYLPLYVSTTIFLGGLVAYLVNRHRASGAAEHLGGRGMLFAAGLIAGESLTGVILAIPIVLSGRADVMALPQSLQLTEPGATLLGLALFTALALLLYRVAQIGVSSRSGG
jgi:uncharacterized oligopeptide transporter (OPT) family protein